MTGAALRARRLHYLGTMTDNAAGRHSKVIGSSPSNSPSVWTPHRAGCGYGGAARLQIGNPGQAEVRAAPAGREMPDEAMPVRPCEQAQVETGAVEARVRGDPKAATGRRVGEHREGGGVLLAIDVHDKDLRPPADEMLDPGDPERALSSQTLQRGFNCADDRGVHADTGHHEEIPLTRLPDRHLARPARGDHVRDRFDLPRETQFLRQGVCGAAGPDGERGRAAHQRLERFVHGTVSAMHDDRLDARSTRIATEPRRVPGGRGRPRLHVQPAPPERVHRPRCRVVAIARPAGTRVVDEQS